MNKALIINGILRTLCPYCGSKDLKKDKKETFCTNCGIIDEESSLFNSI